MKVTMLTDNGKEELLLGNDVENDQRAMVLIPRGSIFAAENLKVDCFTFVSCATTPNFTYDGFRLVEKAEIRERSSQRLRGILSIWLINIQLDFT